MIRNLILLTVEEGKKCNWPWMAFCFMGTITLPGSCPGPKAEPSPNLNLCCNWHNIRIISAGALGGPESRLYFCGLPSLYFTEA